MKSWMIALGALVSAGCADAATLVVEGHFTRRAPLGHVGIPQTIDVAFSKADWDFGQPVVANGYRLNFEGNPVEQYRLDFDTANYRFTAFKCTNCYVAFAGGSAGFATFDGALNFYIDGVRLNQIAVLPEPSAWALMILGFGVTGAASRRRRRISAAISARA